jgi:hypothetical protein
MKGLSISPRTLRRFKRTSIQTKTRQVRNIETKANPCFNVQKPNGEPFLIRKLAKQDIQLKALHDLEWIFSELLENSV